MRYLDTGAMYRAAALAMLRAQVDLDDPAAIADGVAGMRISSVADPVNPDVQLDGESVADEIRGAEVTDAVSRVSAVPGVRTLLVQLQRDEVQRAIADGVGIVVEGRDIGTVVLPDADVKVFLTADQEARARRRALQDAREGRNADVTDTATSLRERDAADSTRQASPLAKADDAVAIDATYLSLPEVISEVLALLPVSAGEGQ